jgi:hypothetical protein
MFAAAQPVEAAIDAAAGKRRQVERRAGRADMAVRSDPRIVLGDGDAAKIRRRRTEICAGVGAGGARPGILDDFCLPLRLAACLARLQLRLGGLLPLWLAPGLTRLPLRLAAARLHRPDLMAQLLHLAGELANLVLQLADV